MSALLLIVKQQQLSRWVILLFFCKMKSDLKRQGASASGIPFCCIEHRHILSIIISDYWLLFKNRSANWVAFVGPLWIKIDRSKLDVTFAASSNLCVSSDGKIWIGFNSWSFYHWSYDRKSASLNRLLPCNCFHYSIHNLKNYVA